MWENFIQNSSDVIYNLVNALLKWIGEHIPTIIAILFGTYVYGTLGPK